MKQAPIGECHQRFRIYIPLRSDETRYSRVYYKCEFRFISHYVQMKRKRPEAGPCLRFEFISHYVQMKRIIGTGLFSLPFDLYPTTFR